MVRTNPVGQPLPALSEYDKVRFLSRPSLAWEYLRRNPDYQRAWRTARPGRGRARTIAGGIELFRTRRRFTAAESWGLYLFRGSPQAGW